MCDPRAAFTTDRDMKISRLLAEIRVKMGRDGEHYGDGHKELGVKGQFADIWRKITPLKRLLWDGEPPVDGKENARQICMDLIGHCLLTVMMLDERDELDA